MREYIDKPSVENSSAKISKGGHRVFYWYLWLIMDTVLLPLREVCPNSSICASARSFVANSVSVMGLLVPSVSIMLFLNLAFPAVSSVIVSTSPSSRITVTSLPFLMLL